MPNIVVDLEKTRTLESGLGQYGIELANSLINQVHQDEHLTFFLPENRIPDFASQPVQTMCVKRWQKTTYIGPFQKVFQPIFPGTRYDLWHTTNQWSWYAPWNQNVPVIFTIHDLNFLREQKNNPEKIKKRIAVIQKKVDRATCVTVISNFVASEVRQHLDLKNKPLRVIYNGANNNAANDSDRPSWAPKGKFIFSIGWFAEKKNFHTLVQMLEHLPDYQLVLAGKNDNPYGDYLRYQMQQCSVAERTILPGTISNAHRQWLYANCTAFAFPSLTEGFGLPVIEAMNLGKPVFMSTATSLPEIGGKHGFYWYNFDPQEMAATLNLGMEKVAQIPNFSDRIRQHAAQFNWIKAGQEYLQLYREVISGNIAQEPGTDTQRRAA